MKRIVAFLSVMLAGVLSFGVCFPAHGVATPGSFAATQFIVLIDLSASRNAAVLNEQQQFLNQLAARLGFGDQIVLLQMQQNGLSDHPLHWTVTMPRPNDGSYITSRDRSRLSSAQTGVRQAIPSFFRNQSPSKVNHTDIFTTLHLAEESARDGENRRTVLMLLSDMLQSGQGFEMERLRKMPPPHWIETEAHNGLMPDFGHACVVAIGADATNIDGSKVRSFWEAYFAAADAVLLPRNYRATPPAVEAVSCK